MKTQKRIKISHLFIVSLLCLCIALVATDISYGGIRGAPEGSPLVGVGDRAPLEADDLKQAHRDGKIILLMFGNPDHCRYCEKVWFNINHLMSQHEKDVAAIAKIHRHAEFWAPEDEDVELGKRYGVIGEPWLFVIDREGIVRHIFMGFAGLSEIENQLLSMIEK